MTIRKVSQLNAKSVFSMTFVKTIIFCDSYPSKPSILQCLQCAKEVCRTMIYVSLLKSGHTKVIQSQVKYFAFQSFPLLYLETFGLISYPIPELYFCEAWVPDLTY